MHHRTRHEREQLELFRALPGDLAPRDAQDLMAYPFFSLAKTHRTTPIDFRMNEIAIRVEAVPEHGMATIWDADVLIWAASQIVEARDAGLRTSRLMVTTPREILTFTRRGTGARDYHRLKAALDRLQSTTVATSLRQTTERRMHRFSWINEWTERADAHGNADGIDLIMPDWFYRAVLDDALVLTIDPAYFGLTGGLERWLYRLVRKHAGHQRGGWRFDFRHLHDKSASLSPFKRFAFELRDIARRQPLPGYRLTVERATGGRELLAFAPEAPRIGMEGGPIRLEVLQTGEHLLTLPEVNGGSRTLAFSLAGRFLATEAQRALLVAVIDVPDPSDRGAAAADLGGKIASHPVRGRAFARYDRQVAKFRFAVEHIHHAVYGVAFADATGVKLDAGFVETHGARPGVKMDMPVAHVLQGRQHFGAVGQMPGTLVKPPHFHQISDRNVEGSVAQAAIFEARREQIKYFLGDHHGVVRRQLSTRNFCTSATSSEKFTPSALTQIPARSHQSRASLFRSLTCLLPLTCG